MPAERVTQVAITVDDLTTSVGFYRDVVGGTVLFDLPDQHLAVLAVRDIRLFLAEGGEEESRPLIYFGVADVRDEWERLDRLGVDLVGPPQVLHRDGSVEIEAGFFRDPDGTLLAFMEERPV